MASVIKIKRTSVSGNLPTTDNLATGELALNIPDKRLYTSNSTSVLEIGSNPSTLSVNSAYSFPVSDGTNGQILKTDGSGNLSFGTVTNSSHTVTVNSGNTSSAGVVQTLGSLSPNDAIAANPIGHIVLNVNGVDYKIPFMAAVANNSSSVSSGDMTAYAGNTSVVSQTLGLTAPDDPVVASPDGHIVINISGTDYKLPFFI
jgi:hypothetical protein|tara:strand:- start:99 stop:704 length:606 start_codon:yes stop_codon:yes gene_type:complete